MCINSCLAFTGPFKDLNVCPECAEGVLYTPPHNPSGSERNPSGMVGMVGI